MVSLSGERRPTAQPFGSHVGTIEDGTSYRGGGGGGGGRGVGGWGVCIVLLGDRYRCRIRQSLAFDRTESSVLECGNANMLIEYRYSILLYRSGNGQGFCM